MQLDPHVPMHPSLRYGENPHQKAAFYKDESLREASAGGVAKSVVHWGKEMSYNNYLVRELDDGVEITHFD